MRHINTQHPSVYTLGQKGNVVVQEHITSLTEHVNLKDTVFVSRELTCDIMPRTFYKIKSDISQHSH